MRIYVNNLITVIVFFIFYWKISLFEIYCISSGEISLSRYYPDCRYNLLTIDDAHPI